MGPMERVRKAIIDGRMDSMKEIMEGMLASDNCAESILNEGLIPGLKDVGRRYSQGLIFLPQMILSANTFYEAFNVIQPLLVNERAHESGRIAMGVVEGDVHDIGKNVVKTFLQANGYRLFDLGRDVPVEVWLRAVHDFELDMIGMSTLMTPTLISMREVMDELRSEGLREFVKVIIGGEPTTQGFSDRIGADGHGTDQSDALNLASALIDRRS